jgi:two-component system phosphate regulon response regulator PhoB
LVVEDEDIAREALAELLRDEGYQVATAPGGQAALASIADDAPDLVLSDVRMRNGDGIELVRNLRARPAMARIPVVLMSAYTDADRRVAGLDSGADDIVAKPVDLRELLARIRVQLRRLAPASAEPRSVPAQ